MATNNNINKESNPLSSNSITIDASSIDSAIQSSINSVGKNIFGVYSSDDSFRINNGTSLGTTDLFVMKSDGSRIISQQPCYLASIVDSKQLNVTGNGTDYIIGSSGGAGVTTEVFDQGSDFAPGNGVGTGDTWTAPVTGRYMLGGEIEVAINQSSGGTTFILTIVTSNRTYTFLNSPTRRQYTNYYGPNAYLSATPAQIIDMDSGDIAQYHFQSFSGSKVDDLMVRYLFGTLLT